MDNSNETNIPAEILLAEEKMKSQTSRISPSTLGFAGLPPAILDMLVTYVPKIVLGLALIIVVKSVSSLFSLSTQVSSSGNTLLPLSAFIGLGSAIAMASAYKWLTQKRRIGWNTLALALIVMFLSQLMAAGTASILNTGIALMIPIYFMLQIRDSYSA